MHRAEHHYGSGRTGTVRCEKTTALHYCNLCLDDGFCRVDQKRVWMCSQRHTSYVAPHKYRVWINAAELKLYINDDAFYDI